MIREMFASPLVAAIYFVAMVVLIAMSIIGYLI